MTTTELIGNELDLLTPKQRESEADQRQMDWVKEESYGPEVHV